MDITKHRLKHGADFPYDAGADFWEDRERNPSPATDWAHAAARGVLADLTDRRGIKWELEKVDHDVRVELVQSVATIIRQALADLANLTPTAPTNPPPESTHNAAPSGGHSSP